MEGGDSAAASKQQQEQGQQQTSQQELGTRVDDTSLGSRGATVAVVGLHGGPV